MCEQRSGWNKAYDNRKETGRGPNRLWFLSIFIFRFLYVTSICIYLCTSQMFAIHVCFAHPINSLMDLRGKWQDYEQRWEEIKRIRREKIYDCAGARPGFEWQLPSLSKVSTLSSMPGLFLVAPQWRISPLVSTFPPFYLNTQYLNHLPNTEAIAFHPIQLTSSKAKLNQKIGDFLTTQDADLALSLYWCSGWGLGSLFVCLFVL